MICTTCMNAPAFAKLRIEIQKGAATFLVCPSCIDRACVEANEMLHNAASTEDRAGLDAGQTIVVHSERL